MPVTTRARPLLGPLADHLLLGSGATVLAFAGSQLLGRWAPAALAWPWGLALSLALISPHYAATYRRAYASRERTLEQAGATLVTPLVLLAATVAAFRDARVAALFALTYAVWSGYHYSGQSLGICLIYPVRQQQPLAPREKRWLAFTLYSAWLVSFLGFAQESYPGRNDTIAYARAAFPGMRLGPRWLAVGLLLLALSLLGLARMARARRRRGSPLPAAVYAVLLTQILWFTLGLFDFFFAAVLVPALHSLQYLALTTWHHGRGRESIVPWVLPYAGFVLVVGAAVNLVLPAAVARAGCDATLAAAIIPAGINLHHYVLDGRIWRLRDQRVVASFA